MSGTDTSSSRGSGDGMFGRLADRLETPSTEPSSAFALADLVGLPDDERVVIRHVMRRETPASIDDLRTELADHAVDIDVADAVARLVDREALVIDAGTVRLASIAASRRATPGGIWDRLSGL
jgi:hypothetical protein